MAKKSTAAGRRSPQLSSRQLESPDTLSAEELARRRQQSAAEAAERQRRQGVELLAQGAQLLAQSRPGEAAAKLEQAAVLLPDDPDVAINLGGAYVMQRRFNKAVAILEQASQRTPGNAMVWTNLAAAYLGRLELSGPAQQDQAIAAYERALQIDPSASNVHYNLGLIYKDRQAWSQAKACFLTALEVDPGDKDARTWLAWLAQNELGQRSSDPEEDSTLSDATPWGDSASD